jgi:hypothetical protein
VGCVEGVGLVEVGFLGGFETMVFSWCLISVVLDPLVLDSCGTWFLWYLVREPPLIERDMHGSRFYFFLGISFFGNEFAKNRQICDITICKCRL